MVSYTGHWRYDILTAADVAAEELCVAGAAVATGLARKLLRSRHRRFAQGTDQQKDRADYDPCKPCPKMDAQFNATHKVSGGSSIKTSLVLVPSGICVSEATDACAVHSTYKPSLGWLVSQR